MPNDNQKYLESVISAMQEATHSLADSIGIDIATALLASCKPEDESKGVRETVIHYAGPKKLIPIIISALYSELSDDEKLALHAQFSEELLPLFASLMDGPVDPDKLN